MNINLTVSTQSNGDGTFKAVIYIGDFITETAALQIAISGGATICDALHASKKSVEDAEKQPAKEG